MARFLVGDVLPCKVAKAGRVSVTSYEQHKKYKKYVRRTQKFFVHDPEGICQNAHTVEIVEVSPISRLKRWLVVRKIDHQDGGTSHDS